jgi:hypothetical protein
MASERGDPGETTWREESVGEMQERKYLEQLYESYRDARRAVSEWEATQDTDRAARRVAIVALSDTVRLVEPLLRDADAWTEGLGWIEVYRDGELEQVPVQGLRDFLVYRDGYPTVRELETAAPNSNTKRVQTTAPLPGEIITTALRTLTQFLHDEGILALNGTEDSINPSAF